MRPFKHWDRWWDLDAVSVVESPKVVRGSDSLHYPFGLRVIVWLKLHDKPVVVDRGAKRDEELRNVRTAPTKEWPNGTYQEAIRMDGQALEDTWPLLSEFWDNWRSGPREAEIVSTAFYERVDAEVLEFVKAATYAAGERFGN